MSTKLFLSGLKWNLPDLSRSISALKFCLNGLHPKLFMKKSLLLTTEHYNSTFLWTFSPAEQSIYASFWHISSGLSCIIKWFWNASLGKFALQFQDTSWWWFFCITWNKLNFFWGLLASGINKLSWSSNTPVIQRWSSCAKSCLQVFNLTSAHPIQGGLFAKCAK